MRVVYIGGCMRSGTTLLCQMIASRTDALDVGELFGFWTHAARGSLCSCRRPIPECEVWSRALAATGIPREQYGSLGKTLETYLRTRYFARIRGQLYSGDVPPEVVTAIRHTREVAAAALEITGRSVIVDSSKDLPGLLLHLIGGDEVDLVQIVRDPRAVAASHLRSLRTAADSPIASPPGTSWARSLVRWHASNFAFAIGSASLQHPVHRISYEDLVASPTTLLDALADRLDLPPRRAGQVTMESHLPVGNPSRLRFDGTVVRDDRWRNELSPLQARATSVIAAPARRLLQPNFTFEATVTSGQGLEASFALTHAPGTMRPQRSHRRPDPIGGSRTDRLPLSEKRVVFWQDAPSIHVAPVIKALAALGVAVEVITEAETKNDRLSLGWPVADHGEANLHIAPGESERRELEREFGPESHHIFHGLGTYRQTSHSLRRICDQSSTTGRVCIFSEPWNPYGWASVARAIRFTSRGRRMPERVDTMLLTGALAVRQFEPRVSSGVSIHRFAYSVAPTSFSPADGSGPILFVGKLEPRKRVDLLLRAFAQAQGMETQLQIIGDGPERINLELLARQLGVESAVDFVGALANDATRARMADARALVLPSRFDGWGAVVNEALHSGCYVIASKDCGAAELLGGERGRTFDGTTTSLVQALLTINEHGGADARIARAHWASTHISPEVVARYLVDVLERPNGVTVPAPWLEDSPHPFE